MLLFVLGFAAGAALAIPMFVVVTNYLALRDWNQ